MKFDHGPFNEDTYMELYFIFLREKFGIKSVIETGTYHGKTTEWLADHFDDVMTIEVIETNYKIAKKRLDYKPNVIQCMGSSVDMLETMILSANNPINMLIFLDAHWYTNPVLDELNAIWNTGLKPVLAIHDFKNPEDPTMGYDEYPDQGIVYEWDWVKEKIEDIYGDDYQIYYNKAATGARRGCLFVLPGKERIEWPEFLEAEWIK